MEIFYIMSKRLYVINLSSLILSLYVMKKGDRRKKLTYKWTSLFIVNMMVQVATLYWITCVSYSGFC